MSTTNGRMHYSEMPERSRDQAAGERGKAFLVVTLCLAVAAGATLLNVGMLLSDTGVVAPISRPAANDERLVHDFYAAVNDVIRNGDSPTLNTIVAADVAWCNPCPGQLPSRNGLVRYLQRLHRTAAGAHLEVNSVVAGFHGTVMVRVHVSGLPLVGEPILWGPIDTRRITGSLIAERSNGPDESALVEPMVQTRFDALPPAVTGVVMAKLTFPLKSGVEGLVSPGPTIFVVESGAISVRIANKGRIVREDGGETFIGNDSTALHQGDAAIIPPGVRHAFLQEGMEPAVAIGMTLYFIDNETGGSSPRGPEITPFAPVEPVPTSSPLLPTVQILRGGTLGEWPSAPVNIAMGRAILGQGARLVPPESESILLAVETGTLDVAGDEDLTVSAGTGVALPAGSVRDLRNDSDGLVIFLILTVSRATN
jgi:quercetin dioxygenase-like cupin family protein